MNRDQILRSLNAIHRNILDNNLGLAQTNLCTMIELVLMPPPAPTPPIEPNDDSTD